MNTMIKTQQNTQNTQMQLSTQSNQQTQNLRECHLILDGNSHRKMDIEIERIDFLDCLSEAMLPEIRTMAILMAAERHQFQSNQLSPSIFTDECDWFAARILALNIRIFHFEQMNMAIVKMIHQANQRARIFAEKHQMDFQAAKIRLTHSKHSKNHTQILKISCQINSEISNNVVENTQNLRKNLKF